MKKNTLALNIGEEALIEGFGVVKCIVIDITKIEKSACVNCCIYNNGCKTLTVANSIPYCINIDRRNYNLDETKKWNDSIIYTRITAIVKTKNN